jgi:hypothetical protein
MNPMALNAPYVHLDHFLFEVMINFDYEYGGRLLLLQRRQTRSMFLQGPKQHDIEHLKDMSCVTDKYHDFPFSLVTIAIVSSEV